ncbi:MAG: molybdopterin-dependent oxidoreductase [Lachnospiraceae bacterium]|nr:molybdopterin-dependent oxidoreductase [Lachnospiraceae bacterium]
MKLSRRDFLKSAAAAGTAAAVIGVSGCAQDSGKNKEPGATNAAGSSPETESGKDAEIGTQPEAMEGNPAVKPGEGGKWVCSSCQGCTSWCSVQAYVEDGRVTKVKGNPNSKGNRGYICPRPHLAIQQLYDPDRIKTPLKRTNPKKGRNEDPKFVPISWDEAMDEIAERMMELRNNRESHKFSLWKGRSTGVADVFYHAIPAIFGSPNNYGHASICSEAEKLGAGITEGYWDYRDYDVMNTKYFLMWSTDPIASNRQVSNIINHYGDMRSQAKIAVVDPRLSATAARCDEWLPVIPGQDGALVSAIAHVILTEGLWYRDFVGDFKDKKNRFIKGETVAEEDFEEKYTYGLVKWWNLELLDKTPEWAEKIAGIPAEQIRRVAQDFAAAAPAATSWMAPGVAMQVRGGYIAMGANALNGLVGSVENIGGPNRASGAPVAKLPDTSPYTDEIAAEGAKQKKIDHRNDIRFMSAEKGKIHKNVVTNYLADAILEGDPYDLKMVVSYWNNWVYSCTGADRWEKALAKLPYFVHITLNPSEMSQFADIVLPASHPMFERWGFVTNKQDLHTYVSLEQPVVKPVWDSKADETEIAWLLAEKLAGKGFPALLDYYKKEFCDPETGEEPADGQEFGLYVTKYYTKGIWMPEEKPSGDEIGGWEEFVEKGIWNSEKMGYQKHWDDFGTATGKFEFYSETLKGMLEEHAEEYELSVDEALEQLNYLARGEQAFVPHYEEPVRYGDEKEYPLIFSEHRSRLNREGRSANTVWYQEFKFADPGDEAWEDVLKCNPVDLKAYGLTDGDRARVTSVQGSIEVTVKSWEGTRPGVAVKCYGQGHWAYGQVAAEDYGKKIPRGGNNNEILPCDWERLSSSTCRHGGIARIRIEKI